MELSTQTTAAIQAAYDFFVAGGELSEQTEKEMASYIQNIITIAEDPEIKDLAEQCRDYWQGYTVTDPVLFPRVARWRMNGMFGKLCDMAMKAGLSIFEDGPVPDPEQLTPAPEVPDPDNLSDITS